MATKKLIDKVISDIVGVFTDPILVFPGGWGDTIPQWLKEAITMERLIENMKTLKGEPMTGTDAEACAYLHTASLTMPMDDDWTKIFLYLTTKIYEGYRTRDSGVTMPADIRVDKLTDYQMQDLNRLKAWIYQQRVKIRQERDSAERREQKEAAAAEKKMRQPALFEF